MADTLSVLQRKSLVIIFAFAPAGLGHLRVSDALYHGLGPQSNAVLLGARDNQAIFFHRLTSVHPLGRVIGEWMQYGLPEFIFTVFYKVLLRSQTRSLYDQVVTILEQRFIVPDTVLIIATHFALAHQLAQVKKRIEQERHISLKLVVQVTDDSPQTIWYVPGADLICVPSSKTKRALLRYARKMKLPTTTIEVLPYPVSPILSESLTDDEIKNKHSQLTPDSKSAIHISIPVSGAAAGIAYQLKLAHQLHQLLKRCKFHIVSRSNTYTLPFLNQMFDLDYVEVMMSPHDRQVVEFYEKLYQKETMVLEITKPSEQSFKSLLHSNQRGGVIMLFSQSFGRQEVDNLAFLRRHKLIPSHKEQQLLWELCDSGESIDIKKMFPGMNKWRGVLLPTDTKQAALFIVWCLSQNVFISMVRDKTKRKNIEISPEGIKNFWEKVSELVAKEVRI